MKHILVLIGILSLLSLTGCFSKESTTESIASQQSVQTNRIQDLEDTSGEKEENMIKTDDNTMEKSDMNSDRTIDISGYNFGYSQDEIRVKKGETLTINFESTDGYHDWVVDEFGAATEKVYPGNQTQVTFTADIVGEFEFYCSVGQHRANGMVGTLIVEGDDSQENEGMIEQKSMDKVSEDSSEKMDMMEEKDDTAMMDKKIQAKGTYAAYSEDMLGKTDNTVIFFHAAWCPSCRAADGAISTEEIPAGLTILKADYDSETALKKKYGVVSQHTFVQVDANGEMVKKWAGGTSVSDIEERL